MNKIHAAKCIHLCRTCYNRYKIGAKVLAGRESHPDLKPAAALPDDTRLWAALQAVSGGTWGGSVYDVDKIVTVLEAGKKALGM